jgi:hypothetical protein
MHIVKTNLTISETSIKKLYSLVNRKQRFPFEALDLKHTLSFDQGRSPDRLSRKTVVCPCGDSFSIGAPLPSGSWMAKLRFHTFEKPCNTRTAGVFSKT